MSGFTLVTLRWYHGGVLDLSSGKSIYNENGDIVEVYVDHLIDETLAVPTLLENVSHGDMKESGSSFNKRAEQSDGENIEVGEGIGEDTLNGEQPLTTTLATTSAATRASGATRASSTTTPVTTSCTTTYGTTSAPSSANGNGPASASANGYGSDPATADSDDPDLGLVGSDFIDEEGSDYSTDDSVESEGGLVGDDEEDYGRNMHEEVRELRAEKKTFQRRKRKRKSTT
ncbi:hypothetical protein HAX54_051579 [Datura stramonium]|uniref:Uncharacterized protein n=1 Tax=Datura stramonium TaxID=4076 RepID=A0ABS8WRH1_DATST|nr:hypothetical protein [Datura stramonium]